MCISIPARVLRVSANSAEVEHRGLVRSVLLLSDQIEPGDWVLISAGVALVRLSEEEAHETRRLLDILSRPENPTH